MLNKQLLHRAMSFLKLGLIGICFGKFPRLSRFGTFLVLIVMAFTLSTCSVALGQAPIQQLTEKIPKIPISPPSDGTSVSEIQQPGFTRNIIGDIVYAPVTLDGYKLFDVASQLVLYQEQKKSDRGILPIDIRVQHIENSLKAILTVGDRETLEVKVINYLDRTKVVASDQNVLNDKPIVTVTDLDAQLYGVAEPELAEEARKIVYQALIRAWSEREPEYLRKQSQLAIKIGFAMIVISGILLGCQIYLQVQWRRLTERAQKNYKRERSFLDRLIMFQQYRSRITSGEEKEKRPNSDSPQESELTDQREELLTTQDQKNLLKKLRSRNFFVRRTLGIAQIVILLFGVASILRLFPYTRELGSQLLGKPLLILAIWLILNLCQKIGEFIIDLSLRDWSERKTLSKSSSQRNVLRSSTLAITFKRIIGTVIVILGLYLSLNELNIPIVGVLAGAGLVGFALSFALQDLIKDLINGFRIVWIDSFAVGDFIAVGDVFGLVEDLTLIHTQLRDWEGRLITIPNSEIRIVQNMTKDWSRVDFTVEVGYETDGDLAIAIVQQVAEQMYSEPEWHKLIIEPPELLGIDRLTHSGILIRLWIKTQPLQQWIVGREFRRRLKQTFDREGIAIGIPQQSLSLKNYANGSEKFFDS